MDFDISDDFDEILNDICELEYNRGLCDGGGDVGEFLIFIKGLFNKYGINYDEDNVIGGYNSIKEFLIWRLK